MGVYVGTHGCVGVYACACLCVRVSDNFHDIHNHSDCIHLYGHMQLAELPFISAWHDRDDTPTHLHLYGMHCTDTDL